MNKDALRIIHKRLLEYCLTKTGAYIDHPFGMDSDIIKVKNRIFAQLFFLNNTPMITVNGDPVTNDFYRQMYPEYIKRGYHCPPVQQPYFNTIDLTGNIPESELFVMIDNSYKYVVSKLTKKLQKELENESNDVGQ